MRGGNALATDWRDRSAGLSPHARGKLNRIGRNDGCHGPIPACAGETTAHGAMINHTGAYPRMRGGNGIEAIDALYDEGLSPHARGKRFEHRHSVAPLGPIPACAGETAKRFQELPLLWAYPRMRGGNHRKIEPKTPGSGLSPHARGKPPAPSRWLPYPGPIPACAGETKRP